MLEIVLQIVFGTWWVVLLCGLLGGLPFEWGRTCGAWYRAHGVSRNEAYWRAVGLPALLLLAGFFLVPSASWIWKFVLLILATASAVAGVWWECRQHPEPPRLYRLGNPEDAYPEGLPLPKTLGPGMFDGYPVYDCWKCGATKVGFWQYEATVQDKKKVDYAFAWMPVCDDCAQKAADTLSGPNSD